MKKQPKAVSPKTRALMDEMAQDDSQSATTDQLDAIRDKMRVLRDMELEKDNITERLKQISESTRDLKERELVDMFDKAKIKSLGLPAEGNIPPFDLNLVPYYHANIGDSMPDDQRAKAFAWLDRHAAQHGDGVLRQGHECSAEEAGRVHEEGEDRVL